ncbi:MAG: peptide-methionine (R)-S-oxide reductase, partial [Acetobacteraceae bacterium]
MRAHGTEAPGSCALLQENRPGRFSCVGCGQPLLESRLKFESGTGWPSFNDPIEGAVETSTDPTHGNRHDKSRVRRMAECLRRLDAFMTPLSLIGWYVGPWLGA